MDTADSIRQRRSIRRFEAKPVPREVIGGVLELTTLAPSAKNRQPWRFVVVEAEEKQELVSVMERVIARHKSEGRQLGSSVGSTRAMAEAAAVVLVFDGESVGEDLQCFYDIARIVDLQSIGGAIQTMLLAAHEYGLGTLWICDVYRAYDELREWLGRDDRLVAAVALGYPAESPAPRPRTPWQDITTWLR